MFILDLCPVLFEGIHRRDGTLRNYICTLFFTHDKMYDGHGCLQIFRLRGNRNLFMWARFSGVRVLRQKTLRC